MDCVGFNQSLDNVTLPCGLQSLLVWYDFNQSLDNVTLPCGLQSLLVWYDFDQSLDNVTLPNALFDTGFGPMARIPY
jgi:hypothetical protein